MKDLYFYIVLSLIFFAGCKTEMKSINVETIFVSAKNLESFNYNKYVTESIIIPLQKEPDKYLGAVKKIHIKNDKVAIISTGKLFVYSLDDGQLLSLIDKKGKGPGEYQAIDDVFIESDVIYILDRLNRAIFEYDFSGNFAGKIDTRLKGYAFTKLSPDYFAIYINSDRSENSDYRLNLFDSQNKEIIKKYFKISDSEFQWQYIDDLRNFICNRESIYFTYSFNDTVYTLFKKEIKPKYFIDFGEYNIPNDFLKRNYEDIIEFTSKASKKNYIYSIIGFNHTDDYIYFAYRFKGDFIHCIYSIKMGKVISFNNFKNYLNVNGLNEKTSFYNFPMTNDDDYFYAVIEPNLIREKLKEKEKSCPEFVVPILNSKKDDNPFLLKFKLSNL